MNIVRRISSLILMAAVLFGMAPQPGTCPMTQRPAVFCAMKCCQTPGKNSPCPLMRTTSPRDLIDTSFVQVIPMVVAVSPLSFREFLAPANPSSALYHQPQIPKAFFYSTPLVGPAPPALA